MSGKLRALAICQRTGFKVPADELVEEWTGLLVWGPYYEPRHPVLDYVPPRGESVRDDATGPDQDNDIGDTAAAPALDQLGAIVNGT